MKRILNTTRRHKILASVLAMLSIVLSHCAFCFDYNDKRYTDNRSAALTPIRMMDDDQLFLSVEAERDASMSLTHQRVNYNWLHNYRKQDYSGAAAARNVIRNLYQTVRPLLYKRKVKTEPEDQLSKSPFTTLENYDLDITEDKLVVGFNYNF